MKKLPIAIKREHNRIIVARFMKNNATIRILRSVKKILNDFVPKNERKEFVEMAILEKIKLLKNNNF